jgi:hypothetical protein
MPGVKRLRQIVWNGLATISALFCVVTCVLWVSNFRQEMFIEHTSLSPYGKNLYWLNWQLWSQDGILRWSSEGAETNNPKFNKDWVEQPGQWRWKIQPRGTSGPLQGFPANLRPDWYVGSHPFWGSRADVMQTRVVNVGIPYWIFLVVFAPLPMTWLRLHRRQSRRRNLSLCSSCGYDLRATPGRCPECGTVPTGV